MNNILSLLREATKEAHEALHVHPLLSPLQDGGISIQDYYWCIRGFKQAYMQMQPENIIVAVADIPALDWLQKDMQVHGIEEVTLSLVEYPKPDSYSKYLGYLYVKQGSTLGGQIISKHLHRALRLIPHQTNFFFAGFGEETGERWKGFINLLEETGLDHDEIVEQARSTFQYITYTCDEMLKEKEKTV